MAMSEYRTKDLVISGYDYYTYPTDNTTHIFETSSWSTIYYPNIEYADILEYETQVRFHELTKIYLSDTDKQWIVDFLAYFVDNFENT